MQIGETSIKSANLNNAQANMMFEQGLGKHFKEDEQYAGCFRGDLTVKSYERSLDGIKKAYQMLVKAPRDSTTDEFASGTTYSSTSGSLPVFPIYLSPEIIDIVRKGAPLYEMMPKRAVRGKFVDFNQKSAKKGASFLFENAALTPADTTLTRKSFEVKFAYSIGKVSGPAIRIYGDYVNILQEEIMDATQSLVELIEEKILTGDASTNPEEFSGFDTLITTNVIDKNSTAITLDDVRKAIRYAKQGGISTVTGSGRPNLIVTNHVTFDDLKALVQPWQRYNDTNTLMWGIQSFSIDGIPVMADPFANITTNLKRVYVLDMSTWYLGVLQDITYQELAMVDDSQKFMVKWYGVQTCTAEKFNAMIKEIA
jgi:hypothetical protein